MRARRKKLLVDDRRLAVELFWSRLPAFRAVAEAEHVHRAASRVGTTPSALSRTIKLLEEQLGAPLFTRRGRSITLTPFGRSLLLSVRRAMGLMDDTIAGAHDGTLRGPLHVGCAASLTCVVLVPALLRFLAVHPGVEPHVVGTSLFEVPERLLRGELDLAIVDEPLRAVDGVDVVRLGNAANGIYCGEGHSLWKRDKVTLEDVRSHAFVAPEPAGTASGTDRWPSDVPRRVALYSAVLEVSVEACASGELLVVLPDALARTSRWQKRLRRLPLELVPPTPIFAATRASASERFRAADALLVELAKGSAEPPPGPATSRRPGAYVS